MFATADVGDVTVRWFTVTPAPKLATLVPPKCDSAAGDRDVLGRTHRAGARRHRQDGRPGRRADDLDRAEAGRRLRRPVAARGAHGDVAEPTGRDAGRGQAHEDEASATARRIALAVTPAPEIATVLPAAEAGVRSGQLDVEPRSLRHGRRVDGGEGRSHG